MPHPSFDKAHYHKAIFEAIGDAVVVCDDQWRAIDCNPEALRLLDCTAPQLLGTTPAEWAPDMQPNGRSSLTQIRERFQRAQAGETVRFEWLHSLRDGRPMWAEVSLRRADVGHITYYVVLFRDITAVKDARDHATERLQRLQKIAAMVPGVVYQFQSWPDGRSAFPYASEGMRDIYGCSPQDIATDASAVFRALHPDDVARVAAGIQVSARNLSLWRDQYRAVLPDGRTLWLEGEATPEAMPDGSVLWHGYIRDITERRMLEDDLRQSASVFEHANEGILITDARGTIIDINKAVTRITGYRPEEIIGQNPKLLSSGRQGPDFYEKMWGELRQTGRWSGEIWNRRKNGEVYAEMLTITAVRRDGGEVYRYIALFSDITSFKEQQQQLERIAHYDALTQLPNRVLLADRLQLAMTQSQRNGTSLAVAFMDLDGFKEINDTHGHEIGDKLLIQVAARMRQVMREGDTVARIGGDEFVGVLLGFRNREETAPALDRLLAAVSEPVRLNGLELRVSASIGISFHPQEHDNAVSADLLLRQADQAMYQAKQTGKNRYHFFDADLDREVRGHHESMERIRCGIAAGEFILHYQPKVNMRTGEVIGVEALVRWQHPDQGLLRPGAFLPLIEGHSVGIELGQWVMNTALSQIESWVACGLRLPVSVNIDGAHLQRPDFVAWLQERLAEHPGVGDGLLELEVLESSALDDIRHAAEVIETCHRIGVSVSLDDFGTGYSSLTYLKRLPVQVLKIDQSFVRGMLDSPEDLAILEGVLGLGEAFEKHTLAEGVETSAHGTMLLMMGCELAQGYAIAHPMPAGDVPSWVRSWQTDARWKNLGKIGREDLHLLHDYVAHRGHMAQLVAHIQGGAQAPTPIDHHHCRFGQWLQHTGLRRFGNLPAIQDIRDRHTAMHHTAEELLRLKRRGQDREAAARLPELEDQRNELLGVMQELVTSTLRDALST
jgi:diguanylate cyclase (GGDEF)-like protein/PAS domain S-box-containing protein